MSSCIVNVSCSAKPQQKKTISEANDKDRHNEHAIALERSGGFSFGYLRRRLCGEYHGRSHWRHVIAHREEIIGARNAAMAIRQQGQEDRGIFVISRWDVR
jgi:hypothetical protein